MSAPIDGVTAGAPSLPTADVANVANVATVADADGARALAESMAVGHAGGATAASPLAQLHAGEIDVAGYAERRIEEATVHLEGVLGPAHLASIRAELRALIEDDPDVAALVRDAQRGG